MSRADARGGVETGKERLVFGGMARWGGIDFFGPGYASVAQRRDEKILIRIDRNGSGPPGNPRLRRVSRWPVVRSFFFWFRLLSQVVGSVKTLLFFAASVAVLWLLVSLLEFGSAGGTFGGLLGFFAAFPILPLLALLLLTMRFTAIGRYHGAEHKAVASYEKFGEVTFEGARRCRRLHSRCGTNILLYIILAALLDPFISWTPYTVLQFVLISEAWYTFGGSRPSITVGNFLQKHFTTAEPRAGELEVAVESLKRLVRAEEDGAANVGEVLRLPARY